MTALPVVEDLQVLEQRSPRLGPRRPLRLMDELDVESREGTLRQRSAVMMAAVLSPPSMTCA